MYINNLQKVIRKARRDGVFSAMNAAFSKVFKKKGKHVDENLIIRSCLSGKAEGTMIDVGACFGAALIPFASKGWRVFAFEPDSKNRTALLEYIRTFGSRVSVSPKAVSEVDGDTVNFYTSSESAGVSSLSSFTDNHILEGTVTTTRLDTFISENNISNVDYLKVDVEGHDLFVLKTFPFDTLKPEYILCEFEDRKTIPLGYDYKAMAKFLENAGYVVIVSEWEPIKKYGITHTWRGFYLYPAELVDPNGWGNLVAIRKDLYTRSIGAKFGL